MNLFQATLLLSSLITIGAFSTTPPLIFRSNHGPLDHLSFRDIQQSRNTREREQSRIFLNNDGNSEAKPTLPIEDEDNIESINLASDMRDQDRTVTSSTEKKKTDTASTERKISFKDVNQRVRKLAQKSKIALKKVLNAQFGSRGETYVLVQVLLIYSIALGHVPLLKNFFYTLFGPLLFFAGIGVTGLAIKELNGSFTPFFSPVSSDSGGKVVVSGLYQYVRHPLYAGNLGAMVGWSVMTDSSMRLLLTLAYYLVIDKKSKKEEEALMLEFGSTYRDYKLKVPNRFLPEQLINNVLHKVSKRVNKETETKLNDDRTIQDDVKNKSNTQLGENDKGPNYPSDDEQRRKTKRHNSGLFP